MRLMCVDTEVGWCKFHPVLKAPGLRLKLKHEKFHSGFGYNFNLHPYTEESQIPKVGPCRYCSPSHRMPCNFKNEG